MFFKYFAIPHLDYIWGTHALKKKTNSAFPGEIPQSLESCQGLHCFTLVNVKVLEVATTTWSSAEFGMHQVVTVTSGAFTFTSVCLQR